MTLKLPEIPKADDIEEILNHLKKHTQYFKVKQVKDMYMLILRQQRAIEVLNKEIEFALKYLEPTYKGMKDYEPEFQMIRSFKESLVSSQKILNGDEK